MFKVLWGLFIYLVHIFTVYKSGSSWKGSKRGRICTSKIVCFFLFHQKGIQHPKKTFEKAPIYIESEKHENARIK